MKQSEKEKELMELLDEIKTGEIIPQNNSTIDISESNPDNNTIEKTEVKNSENNVSIHTDEQKNNSIIDKTDSNRNKDTANIQNAKSTKSKEHNKPQFIKSLKNTISKQEERINHLQKKNENLLKDNDDLIKKNNVLKEKCKSLKEKNSNLTNENRELLADNKKYQLEFDTIENKIKISQKIIDQLNDNLNKYQILTESKDKQIGKLLDEINEMNYQLFEMKEQLEKQKDNKIINLLKHLDDGKKAVKSFKSNIKYFWKNK